MDVSIDKRSGKNGAMNIEIAEHTYDINYDEHTGDWCAFSETDSRVQQSYFRSRNGAVQYVLEKTGVLDNGSYTFAPDRTSA